ncbi:MAG: tRNA preQ1(34) S-adenosylmethionine ribosyltransferase-isomerase QueA [Oligosphaeraceae bacterium]|nr:tRNA preQ1(34) S-adenosylmethionine ribosyltransferase-isomerase QueA [Oligosphaeraceae bacterium]
MKVSDFDFVLPPELIAQYPAERRDSSRMLSLCRQSGRRKITPFADFSEYLRPGDCLVLNDTKVIPARVWGERSGSGGRVEALLLEQQGAADQWQAMLRPGRRLAPGAKVCLRGADAFFVVEEKTSEGYFRIRFSTPEVLSLLQKCGQVPLPPYINREPRAEDRDRYQTVFARQPGAVAAPTAGLHFTPEILSRLEQSGVQLVRLTLHVGAGTFKPVEAENIEEHKMHSEFYELTAAAAAAVNRTRQQGGRIFCVGTTTVRVLETCATPGGEVLPGTGRTDIFLYPPYQPRVVDALLTNFHLPQSTLLMLICTFCPREQVFAAYQEAIAQKMRFFSYGDCMLLLPPERWRP